MTKNGNIHVNWNLEPIGFNVSLICGIRFSQNKDMSDWKSWFVYDAMKGIVKDMKPGKSYYVEFAIVDDMDDYESMDELPWRGKHKVSPHKVKIANLFCNCLLTDIDSVGDFGSAKKM